MKKTFLNSNIEILKSDRFFRLIHRLNDIPIMDPMVESVVIEEDIEELIFMINLCYQEEKIQISENEVEV